MLFFGADGLTVIRGTLELEDSGILPDDIDFYCYNVDIKFADTFSPPSDNLDRIFYNFTDITNPANPIPINTSFDFGLPSSVEGDFVLTLAPGDYSVEGSTNNIISEYFLNSCEFFSVNGFDLNLNGALTADHDICVFANNFESNFHMGENASIVIESGNSAVFRNVNFNSCDSDWGSIVVEEDAKLSLINCDFSNVSYPVILEDGAELNLKGTRFESVKTAIRIEGSSHVDIIDNEFINCSESGVEINGNITGVIEDNSFDNNEHGILVTGGDYISIFTKPTGGYENIFTNNTYGIRIESGTARIGFNEFFNNTVGIYSNGIGAEISNNLFNNSFFGIALQTTGFSLIKDNIFDADSRSITVSDGLFNIRNNIIGETE